MNATEKTLLKPDLGHASVGKPTANARHGHAVLPQGNTWTTHSQPTAPALFVSQCDTHVIQKNEPACVSQSPRLIRQCDLARYRPHPSALKITVFIFQYIYRLITMTTLSYWRLLTIAGSDSSGGAGIQADLKTFAALGAYGMTAITALTAQNTVGVQAVELVSDAMLRAQLDSVLSDVGVDAIKIGMLPTACAAHIVAAAITEYKVKHVVLDPVMVATSGDRLVSVETMHAIATTLFPLATLITPNLHEASWLLERDVTRSDELAEAGTDLLQLGAQAVLLKGGHLDGNELSDYLVQPNQPVSVFKRERIATRNTHGTGCTLSSAVAVYLAHGLPLVSAVAAAHAYIGQALLAGAAMQLGQGHGPVNHGSAPVATLTRCEA
jgi:hydroxymethylpyrimidine/phosphomethylpyrimidine kinase